MATKILNPFESIATDKTVAYAAQIHDKTKNKKQSVINAEVDAQFAALTLTEDDLDAIINEVDTDGKYIEFTLSGASAATRAYRHSAGDVAGSNNAKALCFSTTGGTKYYVSYDGSAGAWIDASDSTNTIASGANVYSDSACTADVADVSGGTEGFVAS